MTILCHEINSKDYWLKWPVPKYNQSQHNKLHICGLIDQIDNMDNGNGRLPWLPSSDGCLCTSTWIRATTLLWRHNRRDGISNHQPHGCLLNRSFRRRSKKTSKLRVTGLCAGNSPMTAECPAQMASNAEKVSIWWRHNENEGQPWHTNV